MNYFSLKIIGYHKKSEQKLTKMSRFYKFFHDYSDFQDRQRLSEILSTFTTIATIDFQDFSQEVEFSGVFRSEIGRKWSKKCQNIQKMGNIWYFLNIVGIGRYITDSRNMGAQI